MGFMQKVIQYGKWVEVDTNEGIICISEDYIDRSSVVALATDIDKDIYNSEEFECSGLSDFVSQVGDIFGISFKTGFGACMSAPGFLDCTEWTVFDTEKEADDFLEETYGMEE